MEGGSEGREVERVEGGGESGGRWREWREVGR